MPLTSFAEGFKTHRIIEAADRSAREGRSIEVGELS
jgi:predicted dehydrogenase